ncbi:hypothetical protein GCM10009530_23780 [Microbispora corallina]|uniref:DUF302 domain-containing protein n=1 Tax=Microbispora corallina TaxID=83302 RepID=A0ABQ4G7K1_9ACTN|nr:DUF302 domain-containing protein [Microbispora corallina]GIH43026.1 hypothetical protein Mco01_60260 [Microbispora corallina]
MTAIQAHPVHDVAHEAHRLTVDTGMPFAAFRERYERAVPPLDMAEFERLRLSGADWDAVLRTVADNAPHGFMIFWSLDNTAIMHGSGDRWRSVQYLMGNQTIAQRMFHHDPGVLLYAPLRTTIYEDARGVTRFSFDQPSAQFASFGDPEIAAVGVELDRKVAALLDHLGVPVPERLVPAGGATR